MSPGRAAKLLLVLACVGAAGCVTRPEYTHSEYVVDVIRERGVRARYLDGLSEREVLKTVTNDVATPIEFYGQVIDINGKPVTDMPVSVINFDRKLEPFESPYYGWTRLEPVTDGEGRFSITDTTGGALIVRVSSDKYWEEDDKTKFRVFAYTPRLHHLNQHPLPRDPAQPATFILEKKPPEAMVERVDTGAIPLLPHVDTGIALLGPPRQPVTAGEADLLVHFRPPSHAHPRLESDWEMDISVPGGGIQPMTTLLRNFAPEDGYQSSLGFRNSSATQYWDHRERLWFYLRTAAGHYGMIEIRVRTRHQPFIAIEGVLNSHGARYID